jgi:hypothetical protein
VYQLVGDLGTLLGMEPEKPEVYTNLVRSVVGKAKASA